MAPKRSNAKEAAASASPAAAQAGGTATASTAPSAPATRSTKSTGTMTLYQIGENAVDYYLNNTSQRTMLVDAFMAFLVAVGVLQFIYCLVFNRYPFNAFLSSFAATLGQFVLTGSLRTQTISANKSEFPAVSPERAFADYVICSLILHFFCINFIN